MPSFYDRGRNFIITTSLKVMYSTLTCQPSLQPVPNDLYAAARLWFTPGIRRYLLVRNPYDRLVSFHADKFHAPPKDGRWQDCQRMFFPHLGLNGSERADLIQAQLGSVSFERFMELLPQVISLDRHLWPQWRSLMLALGRVPLPSPSGRVLQIESDTQSLRSELGLNLEIRANPSTHDPWPSCFTAATYAIANQLYRRDFERFGYAMEAKSAPVSQRG